MNSPATVQRYDCGGPTVRAVNGPFVLWEDHCRALEGARADKDALYRTRFKTAQMTVAALNKYGQHLPGCLHNPRMKAEYTSECTCGLAEAFRTLQTALEANP